MKQEDKQLLLQDLCARLPYRVKVTFAESSGREDCILNSQHLNSTYAIEYLGLKPYLRPMSSMTEEERELLNRTALENNLKCIEEEDPQEVFLLRVKHDVEELAYLYKHHYDVNGLIPAGLALSTDEFNPYNN